MPKANRWHRSFQVRAVGGGIGALSFSLNGIAPQSVSLTVWPLGYQVHWSSAVEISDVAQVVDGRWSIVDGNLRVEGLPEPADWELVDTEPADVPSGCVLLIAHFTDVSFGNVVIEPL